MNQVELLRHVADNLEAGRDAGHGLLYNGKKLLVTTSVECICFGFSDAYSLATRTRIINGVEVPAPMDKEPFRGQRYWMECAWAKDLSTSTQWGFSSDDKLRFFRGLCYDSQEAAAANCKARYGIK